MAYDKLRRLGSTESLPTVPDDPKQPDSNSRQGRRRLLVLGISAAVFLVASVVSIAVLLGTHPGLAGGRKHPKATRAISQACSLTRYPSLCVSSLLEFPGATEAGRVDDLVHISINMTLHHLGRSLTNAGDITNLEMGSLFRAAYEDCLELLDDSIDHLSRSLAIVAPTSMQQQQQNGVSDDNVLTWLSAALTNQDTCSDGLDGVPDGDLKKSLTERLKDLNELISNCLAIVALSPKNTGSRDVPVQTKQRKLLAAATPTGYGDVGLDDFPSWLKENDRRLLEMPASDIQADYVVSKTGNGTYRTILEAIKAAPHKSSRRIIIYVKAGTYYEKIKIGRKITNIMLIGDGKYTTIVSDSKSVQDGLTTYHTATFAATGAGFIARGMTFVNWAGPEKHQAVALLIGADHSVVYQCNMVGYQDTLYVHSQRQFYRECNIFGTVDFIFGNAAVVLQKCNIKARRPMNKQKNTITAQNRKDPNQNTGISIHGCSIVPDKELAPVKSQYPTYLGRPWKMYSRVVVMMSYIDDHVDPAGWLEWNGDYALNTLYYGEYDNFGPGAGVANRVKWPGHRVITMPEEARKFSVRQFITGDEWLPSTGVAFVADLKT